MKTTRSDPFTIDHFEFWARGLVLDNGTNWMLEEFQLEFVGDVFRGRPENWLIVPEGNGKTTLLAGLGLYGLVFAEEANIPIAASTRDQAKIMYRQAKGFVRRSKLDGAGFWLEAYDGYRRIDKRVHGGTTKRGEVVGVLEIHAADAGTADGVIPFPYAFLDELHRHKNLDLYETWLGKQDKRDCQIVTISTAGAPGSDFEIMREKIREEGQATVRSRTHLRVEAPNLIMHEHALKLGDDARDFELVAEANPLASVTAEKLERKRSSLTMSESHWLRFTCNIATETERDAFIDAAAWRACALDGVGVPLGEPICIGADGSRTWDTTVVAWASAFGEFIEVDCRVFSVREDAAHHVLHRGGKIDFDDVEEFMISLFDDFDPIETAYDPRYLERSMEIVDARLPEAAVIAVEPQSKHAKDAYQALYLAVAEGKLRHRGDPVVAAHLANCAVERDDRNQEIRRLRKIDQRKPIDAVPALAFAVWRAGLCEEAPGPVFAFA